MRLMLATAMFLTAAAIPGFFGKAWAAQEFYVGEPVVKEGMQIVPNYLTGIEMDHMLAGMAMDKNALHIEADMHATAAEAQGFSADAWIPSLTIKCTLTKDGAPAYRKTGQLFPMTAKDGPHYASNVDMAGPGTYHLTYEIAPPSQNGFIRHVDKASGVPDWWKPITASWAFTYPSKTK